MSSTGFVGGILLATGIVFATPSARAASITPGVEWERSVASFGPSALVLDSRGRIGLVGATSNRAGVFLFNAGGGLVASAAACWPGTNQWSMPTAVSDDAGRIYLAWARPFWAVSFERDLRAMSRLGYWQPWHADIVRPLPDDRGGLFVASAESGFARNIHLQHLGCRGNNTSFNGYIQADDKQALIARSGSRIYLVNSTGWSRYAPVKVIAWEDDGTPAWEKSFGPPPNEFPYAVATDGNGNLLIAGTHRDQGQPGPCCFEPMILKISPAGELLWRITPGGPGGTFSALLVDGNNNVYAGGWGGLIKLTTDGVELWRTNTPAGVLRAARDYIVAANTTADGYNVRKLSTAGEILWETSFTRTATEDESFVDVAIDRSGAVYVATLSWNPSFLPGKGYLRKYVAETVETNVMAELAVPVLYTCEPLVAGPCDIPRPGTNAPPSPLPEVTASRDGSTMTLCWSTNFGSYQLQGTRHINKRDPSKTKWIPVTTPIATNTDTLCTTAKISRYGKAFRLVSPQ